VIRINIIKFATNLGIPVGAAILIMAGVDFVVDESMLAWGTFCICLGSSFIFFLITTKFRGRLQLVTGLAASALLLASVAAFLIAI